MYFEKKKTMKPTNTYNSYKLEYISEYLSKLSADTFNVARLKNIENTTEFLEKLTIFFTQCSDKQIFNNITSDLIHILRKFMKGYFTFMDKYLNASKEMKIKISEKNDSDEEIEIMKALLNTCNKIFEIFLGMVKFTEKFESASISKGIGINSYKLFNIGIFHNLSKESALEICNTCLQFFETQRKLFNHTQNIFIDKIQFEKNIIYDSLILSFILIASTSTNSNHTLALDVETEFIFFLINYIFNRNNEFIDYFLMIFSRKYSSKKQIDMNEDEMNISDEKLLFKQDLQKDDKKDFLMVKSHFFPKEIYERGLEILQLQNFDLFTFFRNQLIRNGKNSIIKDILIEKQSHSFILEIGQFLIHRIFHNTEIFSTFLETYNEKNKSTTYKICMIMFDIDRCHAEKTLKELIILNKTCSFADLFFTKCKKIDSAFLQCLFIHQNDLDKLAPEILEKIINSHYMSFIVQKKHLFEQLMTRTAKFIESSNKLSNESEKNEFIKKLTKILVTASRRNLKKKMMISLNQTKKSKFNVSNVSLYTFEEDFSMYKKNSYDSLIQTIDRLIMFLNIFPAAFQYILPFLHVFLFNTCELHQLDMHDFKQRENFLQDSFENIDLMCKNSFNKEKNPTEHIFSIIFAWENTIILSKILNHTREYIQKSHFQTYLINSNLKILMQEVIFPQHFRLDALFICLLQNIIDHIDVNFNTISLNKETKDVLQSDEHITDNLIRQKEIIMFLLQNLKKIFLSDQQFRNYIIMKKIDTHKLLKHAYIRILIDHLFNDSNLNNKNNFYDQDKINQTMNSFNTSENKTIFRLHPLSNTLDSDQIIQKQSDNIMKKRSYSTNLENIDQFNLSVQELDQDFKHKEMVLCDIDETFSNLSLNLQKEDPNTESYTYEHFEIDLMNDEMKKKFYEEEWIRHSKNTNILNYCHEKLNLNYLYKSGLSFYTSVVSFATQKASFCLFFDAYQYVTINSQFLFKIYTQNGFMAIKLCNKKFFKVRNKNGDENVEFLENLTGARINIALKFNSKILTCYVNELKFIFTTGKVKKIEIGKDFKGIITKILYFENEKFNHKYRTDIRIDKYFVKYLKNLEKRCKYYNHFGMFMCSDVPYFLTDEKRNIEIKNVWLIDQYDFANKF